MKELLRKFTNPKNLVALVSGGVIVYLGGSAALNAFTGNKEQNPDNTPPVSSPVYGNLTKSSDTCQIILNGESVDVPKGTVVDNATCLYSRDGRSAWTTIIGGHPVVAFTVDKSGEDN